MLVRFALKISSSSFAMFSSTAEAVSWRDDQFSATFRAIRTLGRGKYARVQECEHLETAERYAVKVHEKESANSRQIDRMAREFQILRHLDHPHIIRLHAAYESPSCFFMVTELACGGDLISRLGEGTPRRYETCTEVRCARLATHPHARHRSRARVLPRAPQSKARMHARALLGAVRHMHERNLAHRDLKPSNALRRRSNQRTRVPRTRQPLLPPRPSVTGSCCAQVLRSDPSETATIKLIDVGLARFFDGRIAHSICYAMQCNAMLCCVMLCCAMMCCAVLCCAMLCYAVL